MASPSYNNGFARNAAESAHPGLWRGCIGSWVPMLGATGGVLRDQDGPGRDGTLTNMDPATAWLTDGYIRFAGGTERIGPWAFDQTKLTQISVTTWLRYSSSDNVLIVSLMHSGDDDISFSTTSSRISGAMDDGTRTGINSNDTLNDSVEHFCVLTHDGSQLRLFVDGSEQTGSPVAKTYDYAGATTNTLTLGARGAGSFPYAGDIGEVRIYNRALSASEVRTLWQRQGIAHELAPRRRVYSIPAAVPTFRSAWAAKRGQVLGVADSV